VWVHLWQIKLLKWFENHEIDTHSYGRISAKFMGTSFYSLWICNTEIQTISSHKEKIFGLLTQCLSSSPTRPPQVRWMQQHEHLLNADVSNLSSIPTPPSPVSLAFFCFCLFWFFQDFLAFLWNPTELSFVFYVTYYSYD
jgi:hypothetical protein